MIIINGTDQLNGPVHGEGDTVQTLAGHFDPLAWLRSILALLGF